MSFESSLALACFKRNNATLQQWIVGHAPRAQANAPAHMKRDSGKQINFKPK